MLQRLLTDSSEEAESDLEKNTAYMLTHKKPFLNVSGKNQYETLTAPSPIKI